MAILPSPKPFTVRCAPREPWEWTHTELMTGAVHLARMVGRPKLKLSVIMLPKSSSFATMNPLNGRMLARKQPTLDSLIQKPRKLLLSKGLKRLLLKSMLMLMVRRWLQSQLPKSHHHHSLLNLSVLPSKPLSRT